jgi:hypothetical protein
MRTGTDFRLVVTTAIVCCCATGVSNAESKPARFGVNADYFTKYVWRGQNVSDGGVFQPSIYVVKTGFTATVWGNMNLTGLNDGNGKFTEMDCSLDYTAKVPTMTGIAISAGAIYYRFPRGPSEPTTEVYGGIRFTGCPLAPALKLYRDIDRVDGAYIQTSIGHTIEKIGQFGDGCYCGVQVGAAIGSGNSAYNAGYFGIRKGRANDLTIALGIPVCIGKWTIKPGVNYSTMLSSAIREAGEKSDNLWAGVGVSGSF